MDSVLTCMVNDTLGPGDRSSELVSAVAHHLGLAGGVALRERSRALEMALGESLSEERLAAAEERDPESELLKDVRERVFPESP